MKLWVVNHPYRYRRWLKVEARLLEHEGWHEGFIWSEWFGEHDDGAFHVPRVPANDLIGANVDPLVIGPHMYFDYCRKSTSTRKNNRERNELKEDDLILFGCSKLGNVIIDTIFVVGETKQWGPRGIPKWNGIDALAETVHFQRNAHEIQHPEVHLPEQVSARSYRGKPLGNSDLFSRADKAWRESFRGKFNLQGVLFSWVPFLRETPSETTVPFVLPENSSAYWELQRAYERSLYLRDGMRGSFPVVEDEVREGYPDGFAYRSLFTTLVDQAREGGFEIAVEMRLLADEKVQSERIVKGACRTRRRTSAKRSVGKSKKRGKILPSAFKEEASCARRGSK